MLYRIILFTALVATIMGGCKNNNSEKNDTISAEMVNNPITANGNFDTQTLPIIQFDKTEHDFGILVQGEKVTHTFTFKNIGKQDLIIKDASASCGCTVPKFSQKPIAPGEEGEIEVIFDSNNRTGRQVKTITVWTNCQPNQTKLQIFSEIVVLNK